MNSAAWSLGGAVLAGGASRRMGRDKALLLCRGELLWRRQMRVLRDAGAKPVVLVRRRGQPELDEQTRSLRDTVEGAGPLAGLHAALAACRTRWVAVLAVDMPHIDAAWFRRLYGFCRAGAGAAARTASGFEPLAAIYPREALPELTTRLRRGDRSLQGLVAELVRAGRMIEVSSAAVERSRLANWNAPENVRFDSAMSSHPVPIAHHPDQRRFEARAEAHLAFLSYVQEGSRVILEHTYVPAELRGRGLASALARAALDEARQRHWKVVPRCSFVADFIAKNPTYADLVETKD